MLLRRGGGAEPNQGRLVGPGSERAAPGIPTYNVSSGEDDGKAEGGDDDARREEDGQLLAGVAGRVCVIHHSPGDAVRDRGEDVEEEEEQRPVSAADAEESQIKPHTRGLATNSGAHTR